MKIREEAHAAIDRAIVIVLDGVGAGHAPDAAAYGDEGANCPYEHRSGRRRPRRSP